MITRSFKRRKLQACGKYDFFWLLLLGPFIGDRITVISLRQTNKLLCHIKGNCGLDVPLGIRFYYYQYEKLCLATNMILYHDEKLSSICIQELIQKCISPDEIRTFYSHPHFKSHFSCQMTTKTNTTMFTQLCSNENKRFSFANSFLLWNKESAHPTFKFNISSSFGCVFVFCVGNNNDVFELDILFSNVNEDKIVFLFGVHVDPNHSNVHCKLKSNVQKLVVYGFGTKTNLQMECPDMTCIRHYTNEASFVKNMAEEILNDDK